jgi:hypothetical protein
MGDRGQQAGAVCADAGRKDSRLQTGLHTVIQTVTEQKAMDSMSGSGPINMYPAMQVGNLFFCILYSDSWLQASVFCILQPRLPVSAQARLSADGKCPA